MEIPRSPGGSCALMPGRPGWAVGVPAAHLTPTSAKAMETRGTPQKSGAIGPLISIPEPCLTGSRASRTLVGHGVAEPDPNVEARRCVREPGRVRALDRPTLFGDRRTAGRKRTLSLAGPSWGGPVHDRPGPHSGCAQEHGGSSGSAIDSDRDFARRAGCTHRGRRPLHRAGSSAKGRRRARRRLVARARRAHR